MSEPVADNVSPADTPTDRLSTLFEAHADRLYRLARRLAPSRDEALDLVQEAFLRAARSPMSIPFGPSHEEAWLVRVLINVRRDDWRRNAVRTRHALQAVPPTVTRDDPEKALLVRTAVWNALDCLPPRRRAVIVMYELEGQSAASIASLLGITVITVRWHLSRGRRELARRLSAESGDSHEQSREPVAGRRPSPSRIPTR